MALYTPFIERNIDKIANAINEGQQKKLAESAYMGDQAAMAQLSGVNPQLAQQIQQGKARDEQQKLQTQVMQSKLKESQHEQVTEIAKNAAKMPFEQARDYAANAAAELGIDAPPLTPEHHAQFVAAYGSEANGEVKSSQILDDGTTIQVMKDGSTRVVDASGNQLSGESRSNAIRTAQDYGVDVQSRRAGGRQQAVSNVDLTMKPVIAGATEKSTTQTKQSLDLADKFYQKITPINNSIANFDDAIRLIDSGAGTGKIESLLPSFRQSSIELDNVRRNLGLNVIQNTTFGALSEGELKLAMDTALPTGLNNEQLKQWIQAKKNAQVKMRDYLENAISYLGEGHSVTELSKLQKQEREAPTQNHTPGTHKTKSGIQFTVEPQ